MNEMFDILGWAVTEDTCKSIITLELSVVLGILGIAITIFTVVYSFISNKLHEKKLTERSIHIAEVPDPYMQAEVVFQRNYIAKNKAVNSILIRAIYISLGMGVCLFVNLFCYNKYLFVLTQILAIVYFSLFVILIISYIQTYIKEVKR